MDYTKITLGELLSNENETIRRNATSILKQLQRRKLEVKSESVETKIKTNKELKEGDKCPNCFEITGSRIIKCDEGHIFCEKCGIDICDIPF